MDAIFIGRKFLMRDFGHASAPRLQHYSAILIHVGITSSVLNPDDRAPFSRVAKIRNGSRNEATWRRPYQWLVWSDHTLLVAKNNIVSVRDAVWKDMCSLRIFS